MPATQGASPSGVAGLRMRSVPSQPGADKGSTTAMRPANSDQSLCLCGVAASIEFILATIQRASEFTGSTGASNHDQGASKSTRLLRTGLMICFGQFDSENKSKRKGRFLTRSDTSEALSMFP